MPRQPNEIPTQSVSTVIPLPLYERLKPLADARRWSMSKFVAVVLEEAVDKLSSDHPR